MKTILGEGMKAVFEYYNIQANNVLTKNFEYGWQRSIEVWELTDEECDKFFELLKNVDDDEFVKLFSESDSWWRYATGSNLGAPDNDFTVNGYNLIAWDGVRRETFADNEYEEYVQDEEECGVEEFEIDSFEEWEKWNYPRDYSNIYDYMCEELGASTEKNTTAIIMDLAKYNNITVAELLNKYI